MEQNAPTLTFHLTQNCLGFSCLHLLLGPREFPFCALPWNGSLSPQAFQTSESGPILAPLRPIGQVYYYCVTFPWGDAT